MAQKRDTKVEEGIEKEGLRPEQLKRRLDNLDQRLDAIDTIVTAVADRIMKQPLSVTMTCPYCGRIIEIAVVGNEKPVR
ncbi:MAG: hypothetical protein ACE5IE_00980 [Dehalococcoidia bacterium]